MKHDEGQLYCLLYDVFYSLVYFVSAVGSPVCGFGIDKLGRNIFWLLIGVIVTAVCHGIMAFTFMTPFVPMVDNLTYFSICTLAIIVCYCVSPPRQ